MMKKNFLYMAAAATALTFAACSSEDVVEAPTPNLITPEMATSYANVKISMPGGFGTRATEDGGFDRGTVEEATVNDLTLVLVDGSGEIVGTGYTNKFSTPEDNIAGTTSVSDAYSNCIIKVSLNPGSAVPTKMYAYVNAGEGVDGSETATTDNIGNTTDGFVMTNSGYFDGGNYKIAVDIDAEDQLYATEDEAKAGSNVVNIYVERLAAKVGLGLHENFNNDVLKEGLKTADIALYDVDGNQYKIVYDPWSWATTGLADKTYMLKQQWSEDLSSWVNGTNRSYWAKSVYYGTTYTEYVDASPLTYRSANNIISEKSKLGHKFTANGDDYVMEHTFGDAAKNGDSFDPVMTSTSAIVVGQYKVVALDDKGDATKFKGTNDGEYDFYVALRGGEEGKASYTIYNKKELVMYIFNRCGIAVATEKNGTAETWESKDITEYLDVVKDGAKYKLALKDGKTLYYGEGFEYEVGTNQLSATSNAKHYLNGWAYFFVPIEHNYQNMATVGSYGVVRNHSYKITVNKINGLGAPLDEGKIGTDPKDTDPDNPDPTDPGEEPIEPNPDDLKDAYINATLNVLSWHIYNQSVDL